MSDPIEMVRKKMKSKTMAVIILNVGDGDAIIVRFPPLHGKRTCGVIDCYNTKKTFAALKALKTENISFICATHPHYDHTKGLAELIDLCLKENWKIEQFWDSGFRHVSKTHYDLIQLLRRNPEIKIFRPTSGFETVINKVRVLVLSPSIYLKNRYDTFGTNINNASIVIKLEYPSRDMAKYYLSQEDVSDEELENEENIKQNTVVLAGDAQFDAWARVTQEFPELKHTDNRGQLIDAEERKIKPLRCQVLKVSHHMSKHGVTLEVLETLKPRYIIASCSSTSKHGFPHELTVMAAEDINKKSNDKGLRFTGHRISKLSSGTLVALFDGGKSRANVYPLGDSVRQNAPIYLD